MPLRRNSQQPCSFRRIPAHEKIGEAGLYLKVSSDMEQRLSETLLHRANIGSL
jgi:hypothetical protein